MKFYFTFGQNHVHPITQEPMKDYWIEIECDDMDLARQLMFDYYGKKWGMMYTDATFNPEYYPKGCFEQIRVLE
jgi:hypothetical protein